MYRRSTEALLLTSSKTARSFSTTPLASTSKSTIEDQRTPCPLQLRQPGTRDNWHGLRRPKAPTAALNLQKRSFSGSAAYRRTAAPVSEESLLRFAESPPAYVTLGDLTKFGTPPLDESALISSAAYIRSELPHRLARRVLAHRALPFIVGRNPYIAQVYQLYESSFATLSAVKPIRTKEDNEEFTKTLDQLVEDHSQNVPVLAKGFSECKDYLSEDEISSFFDKAIRNRIGIRLIAEQHLALSFLTSSESRRKSGKSAEQNSSIGIVDSRCEPAKIIRSCGYHVESLCEGVYGRAPDLVLNGDVRTRFTYIPSHVDYIVTELLKNAFRATVEAHPNASHGDLPPVIVTVSQSETTPGLVTLRVRDAAGGIPAHLIEKVNSYAFTTVAEGDQGEERGDETDYRDDGPYSSQQNAGMGPGDGGLTGTATDSHFGSLAGLGFGLPLSKVHCEYFGGSLELVSLYGHGTDAYVVLKGDPAV